ncbi:MAG: Bug family tripartite tricarboxylate transporter substrate binding protein [Betaproteobacteria bacterium]
MTSRNPVRRRFLALAATAAVALTAAAPVHAQAPWPTQPVKILVGFPGGSTPDISARALADALAKAWGQPVVVENRPGAGGNLAADAVAKATDGHTLGVVINGNLTTAKQLNPRLPYDPAKDFAVVSLLATAPLVLVTPAEQPQGAAWLAAARAAGDQWSYGSGGIGSGGPRGGELVNGAIGAGAVHVPYNGNPAVLTALLGGQIQMALVPPGLALPQVKAGKLHAIGVTGPKSELAPGVPALADLGVRMQPLEVWNALVAPAGLPRPALERLVRDVPAVMKEAETRQRFVAGGWEPVGSDAAAAAARVQAEARTLGEIITRRGIKLE